MQIASRRARGVATVGLIASALLLVPTATARSEAKFVSKRYAYSIVLPGGSSRWTAQLATIAWSSRSIGGIGAPWIDTFSDQLTSRQYLVGAQRTHSTLRQWTQFVVSARSSVCGAPKPAGSSTLGGTAARVVTWSCTDGYRVIVIAARHRRSGYFMLVASPNSSSPAANMRAFTAARRGFRFLR